MQKDRGGSGGRWFGGTLMLGVALLGGRNLWRKLDAHVQEIVRIAEVLGQPLQWRVRIDGDAVRVHGHCFCASPFQGVVNTLISSVTLLDSRQGYIH